VALARAAFSAVLGGHGYFYGSSEIYVPNPTSGGGGDGSRAVRGSSAEGALYTGVPCRPFFPRGFMWDEGFHQLIVAPFDPSITLDVLAHWFGRIEASGHLFLAFVKSRSASEP
jgi:mannosyl-oligosaccharide glucosidase